MATRFHLDEQISPVIAYGLRRHGIDVTTSQEMALLGRGDEDQLAFAISEKRVLVTHDQDFPRIHAQGISHHGICFCHIRKYSLGDLLRTLQIVAACLSEDDFQGRLEYL